MANDQKNKENDAFADLQKAISKSSSRQAGTPTSTVTRPKQRTDWPTLPGMKLPQTSSGNSGGRIIEESLLADDRKTTGQETRKDFSFEEPKTDAVRIDDQVERAAAPRKKKRRRRKPKKWYQKRKNQMLMKLGAAALAILLILALFITGIVKLVRGRAEQQNGNQDTLALSDQLIDQRVQAPTAPDGTGTAGIMEVPADRAEICRSYPGWNDNGYGKIWYGMEDGYIYYNGWLDMDGNTYHFTEDGYADRGWVLIGDKSCYFTELGVYVPDQDNSKLVAFTFDDGPSQGMDEILKLCEETGSRVTFFMIGAQVEIGGAVIPHIMHDRCELGNHSNTHGHMVEKTTEECAADFAQCDSFIASFSGGPESTVVRFPYGDFNPEQPGAVGKGNIFWNIDSLDWDLLDADLIYQQVMPNITEGDIILMHDRHEATVEACRRMFPELIAKGYQLVTVSELAAAKGYRLEGGKTYYSLNDEELADGTAIRSAE